MRKLRVLFLVRNAYFCWMEWVSENTEDLDKIASEIIVAAHNHTVWCFYGQMGAGKTTLIKALCARLGVINTVQSPTFSIVNEYVTDQKRIIYHFDCYRLKTPVEALDIGIEEYLDSGYLCFIEWPDIIDSLLPEPTFKISIVAQADQTRQIICF